MISVPAMKTGRTGEKTGNQWQYPVACVEQIDADKF